MNRSPRAGVSFLMVCKWIYALRLVPILASALWLTDRSKYQSSTEIASLRVAVRSIRGRNCQSPLFVPEVSSMVTLDRPFTMSWLSWILRIKIFSRDDDRIFLETMIEAGRALS